MINEKALLDKIKYIKSAIKQSCTHAELLKKDSKYLNDIEQRADFIYFNFKHYTDDIHKASIALMELEDMIIGEDEDV